VKNSNSTSHRILRGACFIAAAASCTLIFRDIPPIRASLDEGRPLGRAEPAATVAWIHGPVSVRGADFETFGRARAGQNLWKPLDVRASEGGSAKLSFSTGHALWLGQRSELQWTGDEILLVSGEAGIRKYDGVKGALPISTGTFVAVPEGNAEFALREIQPAQFRLEVHNGRVTLRSRSGSLSLRAGEEATWAEGTREPARIGHASFSLLAPRDAESLSPTEGQVKFRWNVDVNASEGRALEMQLSADPGFGTIARSYVVPASEPPLPYVEISLSVAPSNDPWYWRVRARGDAQFSHVEHFWLLPNSAPSPRYPDSGAQVEEGRPLELIWNPVDNALGYEVELAGLDRRTSKRWISIPSLPQGLSSWRVRAVLPGGMRTPWSSARSLVVKGMTR
jgi:hypothetical protein